MNNIINDINLIKIGVLSKLMESDSEDDLIEKTLNIIENNKSFIKGMGIGILSIGLFKVLKSLIGSNKYSYLYKKKKYQILKDPNNREQLQDFINYFPPNFYNKKNER